MSKYVLFLFYHLRFNLTTHAIKTIIQVKTVYTVCLHGHVKVIGTINCVLINARANTYTYSFLPLHLVSDNAEYLRYTDVETTLLVINGSILLLFARVIIITTNCILYEQ
jgi:hypothetical protein